MIEQLGRTPGLRPAPRCITHRGSDASSYLVLHIAVLVALLVNVTVAIPALLNNHRWIPLAPESLNTTPAPRLAINSNFPDPSLLFHEHTWYAYATNAAAGIINSDWRLLQIPARSQHIQLATSIDFIHWELKTIDPLPETGDWVIQGKTHATSLEPSLSRAAVWAPSVIIRPSDKKYILYYSANSNGPTRSRYGVSTHCIGAAVRNSPVGPFKPMRRSLACPFEKGGAIDPYGFIDSDNSIYVLYKINGNSIGHGGLCGNTVNPIVPTPLMLQRMMSDGLTPEGEPIQILDRTDADGPLIEAPAMISDKGTYYLFYSSGCTASPTYDVMYATAKNIGGPYTRATGSLLSNGSWGLEAPGSVGVSRNGRGGWNMAFHARV